MLKATELVYGKIKIKPTDHLEHFNPANSSKPYYRGSMCGCWHQNLTNRSCFCFAAAMTHVNMNQETDKRRSGMRDQDHRTRRSRD